jgi:hypothetical protein
MKHSAVEALVRDQFDIGEDQEVTVEYLHYSCGWYLFEVHWIDDMDVLHQVNMELPHLNCRQKNMVTGEEL